MPIMSSFCNSQNNYAQIRRLKDKNGHKLSHITSSSTGTLLLLLQINGNKLNSCSTIQNVLTIHLL